MYLERWLELLPGATPAAWRAVLIFTIAVLGGLVVHRVIFFILSRWGRKQPADSPLAVVCSLRWRTPSRVLFPALALSYVLPLMRLPAHSTGMVRQVLGITIIASISWLCLRGIEIFRDFFLARLRVDRKDNLRARQAATQIKVLEQVLTVAVIIVGIASALMLFDKVRQLGMSLLASAGIIGITLGFAAQRSIANLFAGVQLAVTQPIRIDDVVIVEGEWGRIEEITLTYVVVRIWDLRRLIVPVGYFMEKPFQNWTRVSADILGTVFIYADYTIPVEAVREKFKEIVSKSPDWDGKVCGVQVTSATDKTIEMRGLVSALDASKAWDLRCYAREKMLEFLQKEYPQCLPRVRIEDERTGRPS
jgi:small-conductance mechanosensitive channel